MALLETHKNSKRNNVYTNIRGLSKDEAQVLLDMKDKKLNKVYKGLSESSSKRSVWLERKFC